MKEIVKIRTKDTASGGKSLYLDINYNGQRTKEYLKLYLVPERTPAERQQNKQVMQVAQAIKAERTKQILSNKAGIQQESKIYLENWLMICSERAIKKAREGQNKHTWGVMLRNTAKIIQEYAAHTPICNVDKRYLLKIIDILLHEHRTKQGGTLAPKTADKYYSCLRYALNEAVRNELIYTNPCSKLSDTDKIKVHSKPREYLTAEELKRMADTPTKATTTKNVFLFMCFCGLRISDIKRLRWSDVERDGDNMRIRITQQKTDEPLYLPLSEQAKKYLPARPTSDTDTLIFCNLPTEPAMNRNIKTWTRRAGINKKVTLHVARHTFATLLISRGADIYTTSNLLGHTNIRTTQIYAKIVDTKKEDAVKLLNNIEL